MERTAAFIPEEHCCEAIRGALAEDWGFPVPRATRKESTRGGRKEPAT